MELVFIIELFVSLFFPLTPFLSEHISFSQKLAESCPLKAGPRQNGDEDNMVFLSPSPFSLSVPWIYLIGDDLSGSDKGVSKLNSALSLEDDEIRKQNKAMLVEFGAVG